MSSIVSYIGFAIKSGAVIKGLDDVLKSKKRIYLILVTEDTQINSKSKITEFATLKSIPLSIIKPNMFESLNIFGVKIMAITDKNLAGAIIKSIN